MGVFAVGRGRGYANAGADGDFQAIFGAVGGGHQEPQQGVGELESLSGRRAGQNHNKLVAAVAEAPVLLAHQMLKTMAYQRQQFAADQMSVGIVDQLEVVQIDEGQAEGLALLEAVGQLPAQHAVEMAYVVEAGGVVGDGELLDAGHVAGVLNGDGGMVGENVQQGDGVVSEMIGARIVDFDHAVGAFASAQGQSDDRADDGRYSRSGMVESWIVRCFGNNQGFAVLHDPAGDAFADFDEQIPQRILLAPGSNGIVQLLRLLVEHQQGPQLRAHGVLHVFEDGAQNRIQIEARGQRAGELVEHKKIGKGHAPFDVIAHRSNHFAGEPEAICHKVSMLYQKKKLTHWMQIQPVEESHLYE